MESSSLVKKLTKRLWRKNQIKPLGSIAISVYSYLLWQLKKQKCDSILVSDSELAIQLKLSRNTIRLGREKLKKSGLLNYQVQPGRPVQYIFDFAENIFVEANLKPLEKSVKVPNVPAAEDPLEVEKQPIVSEKQSGILYPDFSEILAYAQSLEEYSGELETALSEKYQSWVSNGWKNAFGKPIANWQQSVKNSLPYLRKPPPGKTDFQNIPEIKRP